MGKILIAYNNHNPTLRLLIKYEDLRKNTLHELEKIYHFLEIRLIEQDLKKIVEEYDFDKIPTSERGLGKFNRSAKVGGWRNNFSKDEQRLRILSWKKHY